MEYRVHYAGWNTRYDEWIKCDVIISVIDIPAADAVTPAAGKQKQSSTAGSVISFSLAVAKTVTICGLSRLNVIVTHCQL